ncbi:MAG: DUF3786 domain-containing protein [Thermodesulfobacteriota bacterium]|nr:DUF3786 domain-containing protein [Thermodesulfobacteriota bacterium]
MAKLNNHLDVIRILPKTNCKKCGLGTCLAFAVAVIQGTKVLSDCPDLDGGIIAEYQVRQVGRNKIEGDLEQIVGRLEEKVRRVDFASTPARLGAKLTENGLAVTMLGKNFLVSREGGVESTCHTNMWLRIPLLNYVIRCRGREPSGQWMPLRELPGGADWGRFYEHRCEKPLKKIIDEYTNLFEIMIDVFQAQPAQAFDSDIAVVLHPLPKVPLLICYWKPEDGMDSDLSLFWDANAEDNLNIDSLYYLGVGMTAMFEKIARTHGK